MLKASLLTAGLFLFTPTEAAAKTETFGVGNKTFLLNGKPFIIKAAEVHYPRIPRPYWEQRIKMCKALGMNTGFVCIVFGTYTNRKKASSTSRAITTWRNLSDWHKKTDFMSSCVPARTYAPNGKWAACPGGC